MSGSTEISLLTDISVAKGRYIFGCSLTLEVNHAIATISKRISTHSRQRVVKSMQRCAVAKYTKPKNTSKKVNFAA